MKSKNKLILSVGLSAIAFAFVALAIVAGSASATETNTDQVGMSQWYAKATATPTTTPLADRQATPTPLDNQLEPGQARAIAAATDAVYSPPIENPVEFADFPVRLTFDEFYDRFDMRRGWVMSEKLLSLDGLEVTMEGYVAPPLKPEIDFLVLTGIQLAVCPFCSTAADWPDRIALVYLPDPRIVSTEYPVRVVGRLELGSMMDLESGMVSLVRIYADEIEAITD